MQFNVYLSTLPCCAPPAGQMRKSPYQFAGIGSSSPTLWLTRNYAVLDGPSFPVIAGGAAVWLHGRRWDGIVTNLDVLPAQARIIDAFTSLLVLHLL